jgi:hypothetical protein
MTVLQISGHSLPYESAQSLPISVPVSLNQLWISFSSRSRRTASSQPPPWLSALGYRFHIYLYIYISRVGTLSVGIESSSIPDPPAWRKFTLVFGTCGPSGYHSGRQFEHSIAVWQTSSLLHTARVTVLLAVHSSASPMSSSHP